MPLSIIIGYDPGGNDHHGVAELRIEGGEVRWAETWTMSTTEDVISFIEGRPAIAALGVDTLSCWFAGHSSWRPADRWLRQRHPTMQNRVVAPMGCTAQWD
jgi:hypothetical protein